MDRRSFRGNRGGIFRAAMFAEETNSQILRFVKSAHTLTPADALHSPDLIWVTAWGYLSGLLGAAAILFRAPGRQSLIENFTHGEIEVPDSPEIAELGRSVVLPSARRIRLYEQLLLDRVNLAFALGAREVHGSVVKGDTLETFLRNFGFRVAGQAPFWGREQPTGGELVTLLHLVGDRDTLASHMYAGVR